MLPLNVILCPQPPVDCVASDYRQLLAKHIATLQQKGHLNIQATQKLMEQRFPPMTDVPKYEIGQEVWVLHPHVPKGLSRKLYSPWKPFIIAAQTSPLTYSVRPVGSRTTKTVHVNKLKPRTTRSTLQEQAPSTPLDQPPAEQTAQPPDAQQQQPDETHLQPERIIDSKTKKDGIVYFKVQFKTLPRSQAVWMKIDDISNTTMIQQYLDAKYARKQRKLQQEKWLYPRSTEK